ncbi:AbrB/MazE/SpoVT family DNA-binding domain-containing protein [Candidatus Gottesmanbacteria bacterium]|nr:AbrB/MazE/SpoVT family DNA-binding domain-containing protein [Candidatus Gottesmanbacteria bacterium]
MTFTLPVSSKGQFTIPYLIREALGIRAGTKLAVTLDKSSFTAEPVATKDISQFFGTLGARKKGRVAPTRPLDSVFQERQNTSVA